MRDEALALNPPVPDAAGDKSAIAWRTAFAETTLAYRRWCEASRRDKPEAYAVYRAAADREDAAVRRYQADTLGHAQMTP